MDIKYQDAGSREMGKRVQNISSIFLMTFCRLRKCFFLNFFVTQMTIIFGILLSSIVQLFPSFQTMNLKYHFAVAQDLNRGRKRKKRILMAVFC